MTTKHVREMIQDYVDGTLTQSERDAVERHVGGCAECRTELNEMRDLVLRLNSLPRNAPLPENLLEEVESTLRATPRLSGGGLVNKRNGLAGTGREDPSGAGPRRERTRLAQVLIPVASNWYVRIAATVILFATAGALWFLVQSPRTPVESASDSTTQSSREAPIVEQSKPVAPTQDDQTQRSRPALPEPSGRASTPIARSNGTDTAGLPSSENVPQAAPASGAIAGSVVDEHGLPVPNVVVGVLGTKQYAISDSIGRFAIREIPQGTYAVRAGRGGRVLATQEGVAVGGDSTIVDLRIQSSRLERSMTVTTPSIQPNSNNAGAGMITGKITGKITDGETGQPLFGVNILILGTARGSTTDLDGNYTIVGVPTGSYTLRASQIGYAQVEMTSVKVDSAATLSANFSLKTATTDVRGLSVTADAQVVNHSAASGTQIVQSEAIQSVPNVKSVEDVLRLQAGVVQKGTERYLRGGRAGETQYYIDGHPAQGLKTTEEYDQINENRFLDALSSPLSTFSIDVDNASYSNIRRFINDRRLPPRDAVRVEEMINYFTYDYPQPKGRRPFSITTELSACPWNNENRLLLVGLQGKKIDAEDIPPSNLVFLLDVSGSMNEPSKLPLVKAAFRLLVNELREEDRVSIVVYAGQAGLVLPSTRGSQKQQILRALDQLQAGGSTAGGEGIQLAYRVANENFIEGGNNRVILATDGDFNVGVSSDEGLVKLIEQKRKEGVFLSVLGFGTGNLKDAKMEKLADKGNGNYAYVDNLREARKVFVSQMAGTLYTIAKDVKIQIEFNPMKVHSYRLVGYENRILSREDFNNDKKDAGDLGSGHTVTALYEIVPAREAVELPDVDTLRYQRVHVDERTNEILTIKLRYKLPDESTSTLLTHSLQDRSTDPDDTSENFRFAAAVAQFGMILRDSEFRGSASYDGILELARGSIGADLEGYRAEFIHLVESCKLLSR